MMLSPIGDGAPSPAGSLRLDATAPDFDIERRIGALRAWVWPFKALTRPFHRAALRRKSVHAVLADASGAWAWAPGDPYSVATRHADVRDWINMHPDTDLRLWVSGGLMRGLDEPAKAASHDDAMPRLHARRAFVARHDHAAASWPLANWHDHDATPGVIALAGLDLDALRQHGAHHGVRVMSVLPWWHHAFVQAKRCVPCLQHANAARICVVEGRHATWIIAEHGVLQQVRRLPLCEASVDALRTQMTSSDAGHMGDGAVTVVLGQGLVDGSNTRALDGLVLGRLDGEQPPQWLRP